MITRKLEITDYYKNFNNLLSQLTKSPFITEESFKNQFNNLCRKNLHLVVEKKGKIIAYGVIIIDFKFYRECKNVGHIEDIIVDSEYRGKGISKIIINDLIEYGKSLNCYKFILNCSDEYIKFYKKFGLEKKDNSMIKYI